MLKILLCVSFIQEPVSLNIFILLDLLRYEYNKRFKQLTFYTIGINIMTYGTQSEFQKFASLRTTIWRHNFVNLP